MYMTQYAFLLPLWYFGGDPSDTASALYLAGGSTALRPERATSSTWTATFHPTSVPALRADISYFRVRYSDREIGRASCRERVCQYVSFSVVAVSFTTKN